MTPKDAHKIKRMLKHIKRKYPTVKIGFRCETPWFYQIYITDVNMYINVKFWKVRDRMRRLHASNTSKQIIFVRSPKPGTRDI